SRLTQPPARGAIDEHSPNPAGLAPHVPDQPSRIVRRSRSRLSRYAAHSTRSPAIRGDERGIPASRRVRERRRRDASSAETAGTTAVDAPTLARGAGRAESLV